MITFKEYLLEVFEKDTKPDRLVALSEEYHAYKKIGKRVIRFSAGREDAANTTDRKNGEWDVEFSETDEGENTTKHDMTGSGNEIQVMTFVLSCLKDFMKRYDPAKITFMSNLEEESRTRLYKRIASRMGQNYELETEVKKGAVNVNVHFTLTRK